VAVARSCVIHSRTQAMVFSLCEVLTTASGQSRMRQKILARAGARVLKRKVSLSRRHITDTDIQARRFLTIVKPMTVTLNEILPPLVFLQASSF
jgi:hypothetical protein